MTHSPNHSRRNKYHAKRLTVDGERFDSYAEYQRWEDLKLLEKAGEIRGLERQVRIPLKCGADPIKIRSARYPNGRAVVYIADFAYFEGNARVFEDKKGMDTRVSRLKRAIVEAMYPDVQVRIT